jgi:succinylglutamic semialdehyde dehydrogenase
MHAGPVVSRGSFIAGRWRLPAAAGPFRVLESRSPADPEDVVGAFPYAEADVHEAVVAASRATRAFSALGVGQRVDLLRRFAEQLVSMSDELCLCLQREMGRPPWECRRETEGLLLRTRQTLSAADLLSDWGGTGLPGRVISRPLGAVAILGPAMLPLSTSHTHIAAALLAGNGVVWKPSPLCPATSQLYAEAWARCAPPSGVFNLVQGDDDTGALLGSHPALDGVVFTGTTAHGVALRRALCDRIELPLVLHLSAKNAAVVLQDADLQLAAYEIATGAFQSAGQRCTAISRALIHHEAMDEFLAHLLPICDSLRVGSPEDAPFMGPMLSEARLVRFQAVRAAAESAGAEVVLPGERLDRPGCFLSPSVHLIKRRLPEEPYQRDEHFGPDLALYPIRDFEDALPILDENPYGLCASLFTKNPSSWRRFCEEVRCGAVFWNRNSNAPSGRLPFGGIKHSGAGGRGGADAILSLRREVSVLTRHSEAVDVLPGTAP